MMANMNAKCSPRHTLTHGIFALSQAGTPLSVTDTQSPCGIGLSLPSVGLLLVLAWPPPFPNCFSFPYGSPWEHLLTKSSSQGLLLGNPLQTPAIIFNHAVF